MTRDFTYRTYAKMLDAAVDAGYEFLTVREYLARRRCPRFLILRHDVDRKPANALDFARIEARSAISRLPTTSGPSTGRSTPRHRARPRRSATRSATTTRTWTEQTATPEEARRSFARNPRTAARRVRHRRHRLHARQPADLLRQPRDVG